MKTLSTIDAIIKELGGTFAAADIMGVSPQAVSNWKKKKKFPAQTYLPLKSVLKHRGLEAPDALWRMSDAPSVQMDAAS